MRDTQRQRYCGWRNRLLRDPLIHRRMGLLYPWALGAGLSIGALFRLFKEPSNDLEFILNVQRASLRLGMPMIGISMRSRPFWISAAVLASIGAIAVTRSEQPS